MPISNARNDNNTDMKENVNNCTANEEHAVKVRRDYQEQEKRHNMASLLPGCYI